MVDDRNLSQSDSSEERFSYIYALRKAPVPADIIRMEGDRPIFHERQILSLDDLKPGMSFISVVCGISDNKEKLLRLEDGPDGEVWLFTEKLSYDGQTTYEARISAADRSIIPYSPGVWNIYNYLIFAD